MRNAKKLLALLLALVIVLPVFAGCNGDEQPVANLQNNGSVKLWYAYNTENFMQDLEYPELIESRDSTLRLHGVRNDAEPVQLMITPSVDIVSYDLILADLKSENGDTFAAANFSVCAQWYIEVDKSYNTDSYYGFYPDALVPLETYKTYRRNFISAGRNQALWVQANIPADQAAGFYSGTAKLVLDGVNYDIPMELTVYNAEIPVENHVTSAYGIWYEQIPYGEGYYNEELAQAYYDFLLARRTSPIDLIPSITSNYQTFVDYIAENSAVDPAVSAYRLPYKMVSYELGQVISREDTLQLLTLMAEKNIELRQAGNETVDLFKKAYFYAVDEPTGNNLQRAKDCDLIISQCKTEVAEKYFKDQYPDLYMSCMSVRHMVTTGYNPDLLGSDTEGGVQTWCPQYQHWHTEHQRQEYYDRMETTDRIGGESAWWYGCNNPKVPYPTYHLDDNLIVTRLLSWMQYDYGVQGDLYYCVNMVSHTAQAQPWVEVYYDDAANDGRMTYPGSEFGIFGPISTLRLESIFQGREDYECLWQIEQAIIAYNAANGTDYDPEELMAWLYEDLYDGVIPERDNAQGFAERRIEMLKILEQFSTDASGAIDALLNG